MPKARESPRTKRIFVADFDVIGLLPPRTVTVKRELSRASPSVRWRISSCYHSPPYQKGAFMRFAPRVFRLLLASSFFFLPLSVHAEPPVREMLRFVDGASAVDQAVRIDVAALSSRRIGIPLLDGQTVVADRSDLEVRGPGDFAWRGRISSILGEAAGDVTLTVRDGRVVGRITVPGAAYRIGR